MGNKKNTKTENGSQSAVVVVRRKIVQITCHNNFVVFALCNDGTVWEIVLSDSTPCTPSKWGTWKKLPKIPA